MIGTGTVGRWLLGAIAQRRDALRERYGVDLRVVAVAGRDGLALHGGGVDIAAALALRERGEPVTRLPGATRWASALEALGDSPASSRRRSAGRGSEPS